ncbi:MAG: hypothetical protein IKP77_01715 [Acholeplasmatales bacterium]|nr:hypothetical protein [Acholeplasmatales bacterium]
MKKVLFIFLFLFNLILLASCSTNDDYKITVVAPQGAPAVSVASIAVNDKDNYSFIDANNIAEQFTANEKDIIIAPVNAGAKLYKANKSTYKLGAVVTWGNLYFATQRTDILAINDLTGKKVTLFGETTINSSFAKYVLDLYNITPNYDYLGTAANTKELLATDANAIVMTAEPALTAVTNQLKQANKTVKAYSVSDLYKEFSTEEFTQAALFIKADTIKNHKKVLDNFLDKVKESCDLVSSNLEAVANNIITLGNTGLPSALPVLKTALPKCNIKFKSAADSKLAIEKTANIDLSQFGGAVPSDDFYYNK